MEAAADGNDIGCDNKPQACRPRKHLEYVIPAGMHGDEWRCPACHAHYEDPVCLSCGDAVCRACAGAIGGICPNCDAKFDEKQLFPSRMVERKVAEIRCHCPNHALGCEAVLAVGEVEPHLRTGCEWREEACDQCHQQVPRTHMGVHKQLLCARKPMACGYADVGCPTRCAQEDLAAHERDGVMAHVGLLRQRLADTSADLTQCKADLTQTKTDLAQTQAQLAESRAAQSDTAAALSQTQRALAAVQSQIDQLFTTPAAPEGLAAHWDEATKEVALDWQPVPGICAGGEPAAAACCALAAAAAADVAPPPPAGPPVRYRVQATLVAVGGDPTGSGSPVVVFMGPECRCRYRFSEGTVSFVVVAMRDLAESGPSAPATCTRVVFRYDHDMDERGLFYYIGTQGRTQPWRNPAEAGWVTATRSSESSAGKASDLTGRQPCDSCTNDRPNSWWQVDLGVERLFTPTRYTLRHSNYPGNVKWRLQSWRLEGSVDGGDGSWRTLDEHTNEPNVIPAQVDAMATFAVAPERAFPARRFRVLMTGPSPSGHHHLMLSGLEMYGSLSGPQQ
ncbi:putative E3 ubiquitin-protein ligase HECTD1 [Paratrimastix pyriformis]|uniref:E3 ubiquitin-protein ligase HECTD1 n=1 Tax=Paratrimastix pyriformis TaxID=342808 RepID=A0ABQ8UG50_9EUKA|nr:putative E3 ubiquitin-protein ligase HECTD1 [Paratrimastix pyriformis]